MKKIYTIALSLLSFASFSQTNSNGIKAIAPQFNQTAQTIVEPILVPLHRNCGTMDYLQKKIAENPSLANYRAQEKIRLQNFIQNNFDSLNNNRSTYTIPTVVHIVYNGAQQNISDAQVLSQLTALNKDYNKQNTDVGNVPSVWTNLVANVGIEFCLATRDPQGNPTTGITRTSTTQTDFTSGNDNMKFNSTGGKNAWPTDQYLNIWVCNLSGNLLGYAQFPNSGSTATDGVAIDYANFGTTGTATAPFNLGRTATHEIGHWLGLYHIWGDEPNCAQDDGVADTPQQKDKNYSCPNFPQGSSQAGGSCTGSSPGSMFMNYMDYVDDGCMHMFSNGQKVNMIAALTQQRAPLLTSNGCAGTIPNPNTCDSIINVAASATLQLYTPADMQSQGAGWISGTNSFNDLAKADKYTASTAQQIKGLWVYFGYLSSPGPGTSTVAYKIWNNNGQNGYPNTVLGSQNTTTLNIYNNIIANPARPTYVQFPSYINHSGTFYAGIEFDPTNGDTLAVVTNTQNLSANTAWEKWTNGVWYPYNDPDSWNTQLSHVMWPVLCTPSTVNNKTFITDQFDVELFPNPASNELFMSIGNTTISHETIKLRILNMLGQEILSKNIITNNSTISIETADLTDGLYILELTQNDKLSVKKFQISH